MQLPSSVIYDYFVKGGPIMWPIAAAGAVGAAVVLERAVWWATTAYRSRGGGLESALSAVATGDVSAAIRATAGAPDPLRRVVHAGLCNPGALLGASQVAASSELEAAERNQWVLSTLITLAPLLGLLGTITGIMRSFGSIGDDQLAASKVSGGISEALIATAAGLCIAIGCLIPFNYFNRRLARMRGELERTINRLEVLLDSPAAVTLDAGEATPSATGVH